MTSSQRKPSSNSIDLIIAKLGEKLDLTSEQIADVLWLALEFQKIEASSLEQKSNPEPELNLGEFNTGESQKISDFSSDLTQGSNPSNHSETDSSSEQIGSTNSDTSPQEAKGDVYSSSTEGDSSGLKLGVPDAPSIREPLTLARAFRPLMRRVPYNSKSIIDEAATVKRIAEERICIPVLQAELESWLDLALVIDESHSMLIWGHTIRELKKMLKNYGIFRDVRIWGFQPDEEGENLQFFSRLGSDKRLTKPQELIDPTGRRLILIVSDCVSDIWRKGIIFPVLKAWTQKQPLAILQMLPEWMWDSTALNLGIAVNFKSSIMGIPNQQLSLREPLRPRRIKFNPEEHSKIPVISIFDGEYADRYVDQLSQMLIGKADAFVPGYLFPSELKEENKHPLLVREENAINNLDTATRVNRFRKTSSPLARKLASLLAASPVINLPVVRLIQSTLLPKSTQIQVAEVFLGGLLRPQSKSLEKIEKIEEETNKVNDNPDLVQYEFIDSELRNLFLEDAPVNDSIDVVNAVSRYIAEQLKVSMSEFMALLKAPQEAEEKQREDTIKPFAHITASILRNLGEEYAKFADELERKTPGDREEILENDSRMNSSNLEFERNLAVVIGINDYKNGIDALQTAVPDAIAIAKILQNTYNYQLIHFDFDTGVTVNQYATKDKLKNLLTDILPNKIKPTRNDRLIFYFAGHGIARNSDDEPEGFLVPQDADMKNLDSLLRISDVYNWLAELECKHLLVILDSSFAAPVHWASYRKSIPIPDEITKAHYDRFIRYPASQVLTSASHDQVALDFLNNRDEKSDKKHSPFAQGLIEALQQQKADLNNDGIITATELYLYLRDYVETSAQGRVVPGFFPLKKQDRGEFVFNRPNIPLNLLATPAINKENNPYRGLNSFEERHAKLFFGRDEVIQQLHNKVSQQNNQLTVVSGISGSGKSSLVQAGLIPYLRNQAQNWVVLEPIRPGRNPYNSLARTLSQLVDNTSWQSNDRTNLGIHLQNNPVQFINSLQAWSQQNPNSRLLLVIDQFEELITLANKTDSSGKEAKQNWLQQLSSTFGFGKSESNQDEQEDNPEWREFIQLLAIILQQCPQLSLVVTLRSDFESRFQDTALNSYWSNTRFVVRPMRSDELREAIEKPAAVKALYFEPAELVDRLVDEVFQMPGALPLLSFTLCEMYIQLYTEWMGEGKEDRSLTFQSYGELGGVAGVLAHKANEIYSNLPNNAHRITMRRVMLSMVAIEGGEAFRRRVLNSELLNPDLQENQRTNEVLMHLVDAHLIVTGIDAGANEEQYFEPAHDFLVTGWDRLNRWISEEPRNNNYSKFN